MKKILFMCLFSAAVSATEAQEMKTVDSTTSFKQIVGPIERGTLIKTSTFNFYEINEKVVQKSGWSLKPDIVVYQEGKKYKMKIQGMDKILSVNKIGEVIESNITGVVDGRNLLDFKGYDGSTTFRLVNQQEWKQDESTSNVFSNLLRPAVIIYLTSGGYRMKIEGLNENPILVKKIK